MRFTSIITAGIFAVAATAQSAASTTTKETPSAVVSLTPEQSSQAACLEACGPGGDVACTSKCIAVPNPNDSQVNQTTDCVAKCPQGDGSEAQTNEYARCTQQCISQYYFSAGGTPNPTTTAGTKGSTPSGSSGAKVTEVVETVTSDGKTTEQTKTSTINSQATGTDSEAQSSSTSAPSDSAGAMVGSGVGLLAFVGAVLAL
jgi:cobalamin biosynthesis Mg chelatase CobN